MKYTKKQVWILTIMEKFELETLSNSDLRRVKRGLNRMTADELRSLNNVLRRSGLTLERKQPQRAPLP